jgi:hypothetical protein
VKRTSMINLVSKGRTEIFFKKQQKAREGIDAKYFRGRKGATNKNKQNDATG